MVTAEEVRERLNVAESTANHYAAYLQDLRERTGLPLQHTGSLLKGTETRLADADFLLGTVDPESAENDLLLVEAGLRHVWNLLSMTEVCQEDPDLAESFGSSAEVDLACLHKRLMQASGDGIFKDVEAAYEMMGWRNYLIAQEGEEWWEEEWGE